MGQISIGDGKDCVAIVWKILREEKVIYKGLKAYRVTIEVELKTPYIENPLHEVYIIIVVRGRLVIVRAIYGTRTSLIRQFFGSFHPVSAVP
jgi:ABC-type microcin C transport system permease subunit YejE